MSTTALTLTVDAPEGFECVVERRDYGLGIEFTCAEGHFAINYYGPDSLMSDHLDPFGAMFLNLKGSTRLVREPRRSEIIERYNLRLLAQMHL